MPRAGSSELIRWRGVVIAACVLVAQIAQAAPSSTTVLRWSASANSTAYELQIATDKAFTNIVLTETVPTAGYRWKTIPTRTYYWRVRAMDGKGRAGAWSSTRTIETVLVAPVIMAPQQSAVITCGAKAPVVVLQWQEVPLMVDYRVRISTAGDSPETVSEQVVTELTARGPVSQLGQYTWTVVGNTSDGRSTPAARGKFSIVSAPPSALRPRRGGGVRAGVSTKLRWVGSACSSRYRVELAANAKLDGPLVSSEQSSMSYAWTPEQVGTFHWRVSDISGAQSSVSATNILYVGFSGPKLASANLDGTAQHTMRFSWGAVRHASRYELEIAPTEAFDKQAAGCKVSEVSCIVRKLPEGDLWWRVRAFTDKNVPSAYSDASPVRSSATETISAVGDNGGQEGTDGKDGRDGIQDGPGDRRDGASHSTSATVLPTAALTPSVGFSSNYGDVATVRFALAGTLPLDFFGQHWEAGGRVAWFAASQNIGSTNDAVIYGSRVNVVPVEVIAHWLLPADRLGLSALGIESLGLGGGVAISMVTVSIDGPGGANYRNTSAEIGGFLSGVVIYALGVGSIVASVALGTSTRHDGAAEVRPNGVAIDLGYRVGLW